MTDRHDKEMYKSVTVRFSYVDEDHGDLLQKLSEESERRHVSKNKLIIECIKEHYAILENGQSQKLDSMMQEIKETLNQELQKVKEDMRKELYQDVIRVLMEEFLSKRTPGESVDTTEECTALTADFTYEHFCEEAAEELLKVKDLEKRLEYNNLMAE